MWCIIQDTSILGLDPKTGEIHIVLLFDKSKNYDSKSIELKKEITYSNFNSSIAMIFSNDQVFHILEFKMHADRAETGVKKCIRFSNLSRQLWIKIPAQERFFEWRESIERTLTSYPGSSYFNHKLIISNDIKILYCEFIQPIYIQYASYQFDRTRLHHTKPS